MPSPTQGPASESLVALAFVGLVAAVFLGAAVVLLRWFLGVPRAPLRPASRVLLLLATLGVLCIAYGRLVEPRWLEVTHTRVSTRRLPPGHPGVRVVHLSDLHSDPEPRLEERLPAVVAELAPDLIVFTGDAANSPGGLPVFRRSLTAVASIAPTYGVKGNWDVWYFRHLERFDGTGARELDGDHATVTVAGVSVHVTGVAFDREAALAEAVDALPAGGPAIVLYHAPFPDLVDPADAARVDLFCAGHVHGGQVALPWYGALITLSRFGKRFERGLYPDADGFGFPLYVSRGIGMEGAAPRVRFASRPEVALIELMPARVGSG
jgi:predicted MPP superfamily phosphohydrolase